jgi:Planctomycete cytochrome C
MKRGDLTAAAIGFGAACLMIVDVSTPSAQLCAAEPQSFSEDILPIFKGRCVSCHQAGGEGYEKSGLDLTTYEGLMKGTKFGAMVIPRDPESCRSGPASNFCEAIFALQLTASYHSPRARQGSAFSAMSVAAFGQ